jgi:holin-like protein
MLRRLGALPFVACLPAVPASVTVCKAAITPAAGIISCGGHSGRIAVIASFLLTISLLIFGDLVASLTSLPIPGPALGLAALIVIFGLRGGPIPSTGRLFDALIPSAPMLFVPAAVGVVGNLDVIAAGWLPIIGAITLGSAIALVVTGLMLQALLRWAGRWREPAT